MVPDLWLHLLEMLALMEGQSTRVASANINMTDLKKLRQWNESMRRALANLDLKGYTEGNLQFHETINAKCANEVLVEQMASLGARVTAISRFVFPQSDAAILHTLGPGSGQSALDAPQWLIEAFERGESARKIEVHAREHIQQVARDTRKLMAAPPPHF